MGHERQPWNSGRGLGFLIKCFGISIWLKSHVCLTLGNHRNIFFNCKKKYFQDLLHFLSVMSEIKMSWVCTVEDTQLMVVKAETSEKLKATVFLKVFAKLNMTIRENIGPFHRKRLSFPGDLAEARGSPHPKENCLASSGAVAQLF